jgi:hypothetical protein
MGATEGAESPIDTRWNLLEQVLTDLRPGQIVTIGGLVARTGLEVESVDTVLRTLTRARLFVQQDQTTFVRESLWKA